MNAPGNPFSQLKVLAACAKDSRLTILLTGSTTVYTSSMTNPLSNTRIVHVDTGKQGILEILLWDHIINDLPCRIITLPTLGHISYDTSLTQSCIDAIKACVAPIHCIWFVTRLNETLLSQDEQNVIKWLTTILGEHAWNYAILVLTHSNTIKDAWKRANMMKKRSENMRAEISEYTGWDVAATITSVPVTALDDIILDGKKWLPELYQQIMRHRNLGGIAASFDTSPASKKVPSLAKKLPGEASEQQQQEIAQPQGNKLSQRSLSFTGCYLSSVLIAIVGMVLYGLSGFLIALTGIFVVWMLLRWLRYLRHFEDFLL
jgi:hypothetical protein